ncbi:hypothetical protein EYF80_056506 [Liparis tanakae]|uniref:Uncharacterized protein n=1 Tax=Liparis tanakae TaxID=230148 RepID=A0A4Z2EWT4_9TELE|nr:hypothetical protein EYF80_056506 [Liparis tanakae]
MVLPADRHIIEELVEEYQGGEKKTGLEEGEKKTLLRNIRGTSEEHQRNIRGTSEEHQRNIRGTSHLTSQECTLSSLWSRPLTSTEPLLVPEGQSRRSEEHGQEVRGAWSTRSEEHGQEVRGAWAGGQRSMGRRSEEHGQEVQGAPPMASSGW